MNKLSTRGLNVCIGLFLVGFLLSLSIGLCVASSIPKPSVPEFTLSYVDKSQDVPATTTSFTDPQSNITSNTTSPIYHVKDFEIEIKIKNQPFVPLIDEHNVSLLYSVRYYAVRENGGTDWASLSSWPFSPPTFNVLFPANSTSEYTALPSPGNYPVGTKVNFQVEAILGYQYTYPSNCWIAPLMSTFVRESSGWSDTQTITIPATSNKTSENTPTDTPQTLQLTAIIVVIIVAIVLGVVLRAKSKKHFDDRQATLQEFLAKSSSVIDLVVVVWGRVK